MRAVPSGCHPGRDVLLILRGQAQGSPKTNATPVSSSPQPPLSPSGRKKESRGCQGPRVRADTDGAAFRKLLGADTRSSAAIFPCQVLICTGRWPKAAGTSRTEAGGIGANVQAVEGS